MQFLPRCMRGRSITGRSKPRNEDSFFIDDSFRFMIIADGMGGHHGGDVASRVATTALAHHLDHGFHTNISNIDLLQGGILYAHDEVMTLKKDDSSLFTMGTTLLAFLARPYPESSNYTVANVGDSRLYLMHSGILTQVTSDDTVVQQEVMRGNLTIQQAERHPLRHVLAQCVGQNDAAPAPMIKELAICEGDIVLACTDGFHQGVASANLGLAVTVGRHSGLGGDKLVFRLMSAILENGAADDATLAVAEF